MASPHEKLADSLKALGTLQDQLGDTPHICSLIEKIEWIYIYMLEK